MFFNCVLVVKYKFFLGFLLFVEAHLDVDPYEF